jgi:hypothetical protein
MADLLLHHNSDSFKAKKTNCLSIRLAESAVFLPTDGAPNRRVNDRFDRNGLLRGLLVLDLVKPTKITSIDVDLSAISSVSWPEGAFHVLLFTVTPQILSFACPFNFRFPASVFIFGFSLSKKKPCRSHI